MCSLCGVLAGADHWTDARGAASAEARQLRSRVANAVLGHYGLQLDDWAGSLVLRNRTGRSAIVPHLGALWPAAEDFAGRPCDPLDPDLLAALERSER
jgi:hypothetical protein